MIEAKEVNLSLCLIKQAPYHEDVWESGGIAPPFLTSTRNGGQQSVSRPEERTHGTHSIGSWVDPKAGLDAVKYRKLSCPYWESNPSRPDRSS
jgi:hypothetical protein